MKFTQSESLQNLLAWSTNRIQTLGRCELHYYHRYIGSWLGWEPTASPESQCAYRLKHLTSPELEIGYLIHQQICLIFEKARAERPVNPSWEIANTQAQFRDFIQRSFSRRLEELTAKRRKLLLHELGSTLDFKTLEKYEAEIAHLLEKFFAFPDVQRLLKAPEHLYFQYLDPTDFRIGYELGVPARPKTDAVFTAPDGTIVVADWKTGLASEEHRRQGLIYTVFIRRRLGLPSSQPVEARFYYLPTGEVEAYRFTDDEQQELLWQIGEDFKQLQEKSDDPVINSGPESRFRPCVSPACFGCIFRLMCEPFLASRFASRMERS